MELEKAYIELEAAEAGETGAKEQSETYAIFAGISLLLIVGVYFVAKTPISWFVFGVLLFALIMMVSLFYGKRHRSEKLRIAKASLAKELAIEEFIAENNVILTQAEKANLMFPRTGLPKTDGTVGQALVTRDKEIFNATLSFKEGKFSLSLRKPRAKSAVSPKK